MSETSLNPTSAIDADNPWPGLATFTEDQRGFFHGRDAEIRDLTRRAERKALTILFGQSGLGKSSLLQAGVFPRLRVAGFCPIYVRLDHSAGAPSPTEQIKALVATEAARAGTWTKPGSAKPGETLWEFFHHRDDHLVGFESSGGILPPSGGTPRQNPGPDTRATSESQSSPPSESSGGILPPSGSNPRPNHGQDARATSGRPIIPVLVFDQFEELFTLGAARSTGSGSASGGPERDRAVAFMSELAELVENRPSEQLVARLENSAAEMDAFDFGRTDYRVVISLREDYLPHLEGLKTIMPALMENRLRLAQMTGAQALDAVVKPGGTLVNADVARAIVEFVAGARGGSVERLAELSVEPPLLSVICRELNERRRALGQAQITADLVSGNRREILTDFYDRSVADLPEGARRFVEDKLLTKSGFRDNVALESALEEPGVTRPLIDTLVARRLLRIEDRIGSQRVELTHDVLADVVRASRDARQQRLALEQSREREKHALVAAAQRTRRQRWIIGALTAAVAALLVGAFFGIRAQRSAERLARVKSAEASRTDYILGSRLLEENKTGEGLAYLVRAAKSDRENRSIGPRLVSALAYRSFPEPVGTPLHGANSFRAAYVGERRVVTSDVDNTSEQGGRWTDSLWDIETGRRLRTFAGSASVGASVYVFRFSADGTLHAGVKADGAVTVTETETGRLLFAPFQHGGPLSWLAFSPDNRWFVASTINEKAFVWDLSNGELKATLPHPGSAYGGIAFSPDSRRFVTTGRQLRMWRLPEGTPLTEPLPFTGPPNAFGLLAEFTPDGKTLFVINGGGAQFYDGLTGTPVGARMQQGGQAPTARLSRDGTKLVTNSTNGAVNVWAVPSGRALRPPLQHGAGVTSARFTPDDRHVVTRADDGVVRVWSIATGQLVLEPIRAGDGYGGDVHPTRPEVIAMDGDGSVRRWQITPSSAQPLTIPAQTARIAMARGAAGGLTAWAIYPTRMEKVDLLSGSVVGRPIMFPAAITSAVLAPNEQRLNVVTAGKLELWQLGEPTIVRQALSETPVFGARFSPDSAFLAGGDRAANLTVWDAKTGAVLLGPLPDLGIPSSRYSTIFSASGRSLLAESNAPNKEVIAVVDLANRKVSTPISPGGLIWGLALSPDEKRVAIGGSSGAIRMWDVASNQLEGEPFVPRRAIIRGIAFDRSGERLLTWNRIELYLWDVATRKRVLPIMPAGTDVTSAVFSSDERIIASYASTRGEVRFFDAATGGLVGEPLLGAYSTTLHPLSFTADGRFLITQTPPPVGSGPQLNSTGLQVWPVPPVSNGQPLPDWLLRIATAVAGGELDANGQLQDRVIGAEIFEQTRADLAALPPDAPYAEWGRWLLADRATRSIAPGFTITPAEAEKLAKEMAAQTPSAKPEP